MSRLLNMAVIALGANAISFLLFLVIGFFVITGITSEPESTAHALMTLGYFWGLSLPVLIALSVVAEILGRTWYLDESGALLRKRRLILSLLVGVLLSAGLWFWVIDW